MYSDHPPASTSAPDYSTPSAANMIPSIQPAQPVIRRSTHPLRIIEHDQQYGKPYGALEEALPPNMEFGNQAQVSLRRSIGDPSMLSYTERAKEVTQRRYHYNFPQAYATPQHRSGFGMGLRRNWASLPKLNRIRDAPPTSDLRQSFALSESPERRPQSDIIFHEPLSRPNTPVRPVSEQVGLDPSSSPRIRRKDFGGYRERSGSMNKVSANVLVLNETDEPPADYGNEFEAEDSGIEPELEAIAGSPALQRGASTEESYERVLQIEPFPMLNELQTLPVTLHKTDNLSKPKAPVKANQSPTGSWNRKEYKKPSAKKPIPKPKPRKQFANNLTDTVSNQHQKYKSEWGEKKKAHHAPKYTKQMSESFHLPHADPSVLDTSSSPVIDRDEVIIPAVAEEGERRTHKLHQDHALNVNSARSKAMQQEELKEKAQKGAKKKEVQREKHVEDLSGDKELSDISVSGSRVTSKLPLKKQGKPKPVIHNVKSVSVSEVSRSVDITPTARPESEKLSKAEQFPSSPISSATKPKVEAKKKVTPTPAPRASKLAPPPATATTVQPKPEEDKKEIAQSDKAEGSVIDMEASDASIIKGVLKGKGSATEGSKKKSVQFGENFIREVTKIVYPWNLESSSDSDSDSESCSDSDVAEDGSDTEDNTVLDDHIDENKVEMDTNSTVVQNSETVAANTNVSAITNQDEIDAVDSENKNAYSKSSADAKVDPKELENESMDSEPVSKDKDQHESIESTVSNKGESKVEITNTETERGKELFMV